jgi:cytochrome b561
MNKGSMSEIIQEELSKDGIALSKDAAGSLAKKVRRPMWETHIIAGYVLVGLYVIRMVINMVQGLGFANPLKSGLSGYQKFKSWIYIVFYIFLAGSLLTGLLIEFGPESIHDSIEEIHKLSLYYMIIFIAVHLLGVIIADGGRERGIISKIISGDR